LDKDSEHLDYIYVIATHNNRCRYYLAVVNIFDRQDRLVWTTKIGKARAFLCEEEAEEYKALYVSPRQASIVRLACDDEMLRRLR
jgi:hypothetical protein